tara:strand:- start:391 stop:654 length:264 start_codon:yes stop_codon:yes gene_type:complete
MANTKQSIKRARQNTSRYRLKHSQRAQARTAVKAVKNAITDQDVDGAKLLFKKAEKMLDTTSGKGVMHRNSAARTKSRLIKAIKKIS